MKKWKTVFAVLGATLALSAICGVAYLRESSHRGEISPQLDKAAFAQKTQKLQMPFIANKGQVDEQVEFYAKTFGGTVFVTKNGEIVYALPKAEKAACRLGEAERTQQATNPQSKPSSNPPNLKSQIPNTKSKISGIALREEFVGAKIKMIQGEDASVTKVNYFKGSDPSKWKTNVSTYGAVSLGDVYDGIELRLRAYGNNVEKLFCVKPGADPEQIKISLSGIQPSENPPPLSPSVRGTVGCPPLAGAGGGLGARGLWVNEEGQLVAETELGPVKFTKPVAYQEINGKRVAVAVEYSIQGSGIDVTESRGAGEQGDKGELETQNSKLETLNSKRTYGFTVASYDRTKDLIIDPLLASSYLGGSNWDAGNSIAIDSEGNVYVSGGTQSTDFPTTPGAYDTSYTSEDIFVSKFNSGLTSLLASTYLGGASTDLGYSIAIDSEESVYVTGCTWSTDFPTTSGAYDISVGSNGDAFVSKFNSGLTNLLASTFLGGSAWDAGNSIAIDSGRNIYVTGAAWSSDFPTTPGAYDTSYGGQGAFVSKFNSDLTNLHASTYLGGDSDDDQGYSIAIDSGGNVYVTGMAGPEFPTTPGAYDTSFNNYGDAFVSKFNSDLTSLLASTYLGGIGGDLGKSIAVDSGGNIYVTGMAGPEFPTTPGAYDTSFNNRGDAFVSRFNSDLTGLLASTYLGGTGGDRSYSIAISSGGNIYVAGWTESTDFPTTPGAYDTAKGGDNDVFVSRFNSNLTSLDASTFLGGSESDNGIDSSMTNRSMAIDSGGNVYVTGWTESLDFPTTSGAYDTSSNGDNDVFVSKLDGALSAECDGKAKTVETDTGDFELLKQESEVVIVTVTDAGGCPVANKKVSAKVKAAGKKRISISPSSKTTDEDGKAAFTIIAKMKTGNAKVTFKAGGIKETITVKVVSE